MNYNDYKREMEKNNLIESVNSIQLFVDLKQVMINIKALNELDKTDRLIYTYLGVDVDEVSYQLKAKKDEYILLAIKQAYPKEWAIDLFGQGYMIQVELLKRSMPSRVAGFYGLESFNKKVKLLE